MAYHALEHGTPNELRNPMEENESLDLARNMRFRPVIQALRSGCGSAEVAAKLERALIGGLRRALKQCGRWGVMLADLAGADLLPSRRCKYFYRLIGRCRVARREARAQ